MGCKAKIGSDSGILRTDLSVGETRVPRADLGPRREMGGPASRPTMARPAHRTASLTVDRGIHVHSIEERKSPIEAKAHGVQAASPLKAASASVLVVV